jgi:hypothetical protein
MRKVSSPLTMLEKSMVWGSMYGPPFRIACLDQRLRFEVHKHVDTTAI